MYLFFDTETTGLPKDWKKPFTDVDNWPRMVQIAWLVMDIHGRVISGHNFVITPDKFEIPEEAIKVHGITTEHAETWGVKLFPILKLLFQDANRCGHIVAHNINFDINVLLCEYQRFRTQLIFQRKLIENKSRICTMEAATHYCKLPAKFGKGYKWPNLQELHTKLFGEGFEDAHDAMIDVAATAKCFFEMTKQEIIDYSKPPE